MSDQNLDLRDGWLSDAQMAKARGKSTRTQRTERQMGIGPPWTRDVPNVLYSIEGYREWLTSNERSPSQRPLKPHRAGNFGHGRNPVQRDRKRILENA
jgi:hypothetical protein